MTRVTNASGKHRRIATLEHTAEDLLYQCVWSKIKRLLTRGTEQEFCSAQVFTSPRRDGVFA